MQGQREDRKQQTEAALKHMESSQPTPTQEENDLAKVGVIVEDKEDDKSGPTVITRTIVANEPLAAGGYETKKRVRPARGMRIRRGSATEARQGATATGERVMAARQRGTPRPYAEARPFITGTATVGQTRPVAMGCGFLNPSPSRGNGYVMPRR